MAPDAAISQQFNVSRCQSSANTFSSLEILDLIEVRARPVRLLDENKTEVGDDKFCRCDTPPRDSSIDLALTPSHSHRASSVTSLLDVNLGYELA